MVGLLDRTGDGVYGLYSIYRNTPRLSVRHRSPIHHGALMLDISGEPASQLEGFYWTDRRTMGELELDQRFRGHIGDHHAGMALKQRARATTS
jgi:SMODS-associating 2TM, beta-strand rich effector domain